MAWQDGLRSLMPPFPRTTLAQLRKWLQEASQGGQTAYAERLGKMLWLRKRQARRRKWRKKWAKSKGFR